VPRSDRRTVQRELTSALEHTVGDGVSQVDVVEDAPPVRHCLVGREDHRAPPPVSVDHDVKQLTKRRGEVVSQ